MTPDSPRFDRNLEKQVADDVAIEPLVREQYKVYLFERTLRCHKEMDPNSVDLGR